MIPDFTNLCKDEISQPTQYNQLNRFITRLLELNCQLLNNLLNCAASTSCIPSPILKDYLVSPRHRHFHDIYLHHCNCLSTLLHIQFIKPNFINKNIIKSSIQFQTQKNEHDEFTILIRIFREILPHLGNYGAVIDPKTEVKNYALSSLPPFPC